MTWLDDCAGAGVCEPFARRHMFDNADGRTHAAMKDVWLDRAPDDSFDQLVRLYADARMADDPFFIDDYPERDEIARRLEAGEFWTLRTRRDSELVGACVLTRDPPLDKADDLVMRGQRFRIRAPGENWYHPGRSYMQLKYPVVRPPLDPCDDVGTLAEYAVRAAGSMGIVDLRVMTNLRNKAQCIVLWDAGFQPALLSRKPSNEAYVGYYSWRSPDKDAAWPGEYRSPEFEKLSDEEYAQMLARMGIDREEFEDSWAYRRRHETE